MKALRRLAKDESGQVTAWFVVISIILFGLMALAIDLGFFFHTRRVVQNAADPGALAGAAYLPGCPLGNLAWTQAQIETNTESAASDYASRNLQGKTFNAGNDSITALYRPSGYTFTDSLGSVTYPTVYARVDRPQSYIFGKILGLTSGDVPADAEAACLPGQGVDVCPFFLEAPDPTQSPFDPSEPWGLKLGMVYRFKDGGPEGDGGNRGFLGIFSPTGRGNQAALNNGVQAGCVPQSGGINIHFEDGDPLATPKEGTGASLWNSINTLYSYEGTASYQPRSYCDISFNINAFTVDDQFAYTTPTDPLLTQKLADCSKDPNPNDNVEGRWWPILITSSPCSGSSCDVNILAIAMMYVACWGPRCDGSNPGQAGLYGIFMDDPPFQQTATGVSNNPLAPKHVIFVK